MSTQQSVVEKLEENPDAKVAPARRTIGFNPDKSFQTELRRRVDAFFEETGRSKRDCPQMYTKTSILLVSAAAVYLLLVFVTNAWWQAVPLAILMGGICATIGFNVQHDGAHRAYSASPWVSKLMAMTLDLIGGSSYYWRWQHVVYHHTYANIEGMDNDIDLWIFGRMSPQQKRYFWHRWQHIYLWPLYGFMAMKWHFVDDFRDYINGASGQHKVPRPTGWQLVIFFGGKLLFYTLAFGIPMMFHAWWVVLGTYAIAVVTLGMVLSVVFQLAHCVSEAEFPEPNPETGNMDNAWAVHQLETTVDFARDNKALNWLLGGLNFQVEHHLFPLISHVNYSAISKIVEETCAEYGVTYNAHRTFWQGLASHYRFLRDMGRMDYQPAAS